MKKPSKNECLCKKIFKLYHVLQKNQAPENKYFSAAPNLQFGNKKDP